MMYRPFMSPKDNEIGMMELALKCGMVVSAMMSNFVVQCKGIDKRQQNQMHNTKDVIQGIREQLQQCGWYDQLWSFIGSKAMREIIDLLLEIKNSGGYIAPTLADTLVPYRHCPFNNIRAVILTSLKSNKYNHSPIPMCQDIQTVRTLVSDGAPSKWGKSGILQLQTAKTSTINAQNHDTIWHPMVSYEIQKIEETYSDIPWLIIGREAAR